MPQSLSDLEQRRELIARRLTELGDLRPGSITATSGRCGKPECHCHQPGQPGHGPNFRLTYKVDGKTISEALPTPAAIQKAEREVEEFRKFQQLTREFLGTNTEICRLRPLEEESETELKKNDRSDPSRDHARSRRVLAGGVRRSTQDRAPRSGSDRDGHALGSTPGRCRGVEPTTRISSPHRGRAHAGLPLRPTSPLPRAAQQARADRRGPGGSFASLLFMRALRRRPIARRCRTGYRKYGILSRGTPHAGDRRPGGALRSWPRTEESSGRSGGDYQIRGAYRGGHRSRYRSARTSRDPQSPPVGPARGCRRADAHPVRAAGWDGSSGGEERDGRSAGQERGPTGPYSGSKTGMRLHPDEVGSGRLSNPRSRFHHVYRSHRECGRVWPANLCRSLGTWLESCTPEGRDWRRRRMDLESCRPALSGRHADCRSLPRPPASLGGGSSAVPQSRRKAKSLDEDPPEAPSGSRENRKTSWCTPFNRILQPRTN